MNYDEKTLSKFCLATIRIIDSGDNDLFVRSGLKEHQRKSVKIASNEKIVAVAVDTNGFQPVKIAFILYRSPE